MFALTPMQEGMLFHYLEKPASPVYFEQVSFTLSGTIDKDCFEKAWSYVARTNETLRTAFRWRQLKQPVQLTLKDFDIDVHYEDLTGTPDSKDDAGIISKLEAIKTGDRNTPFLLEEVPFRLCLCKTGEERYELIISHHHILYDGWSTGILIEEFASAYADILHKRTPAAVVKTGFKEYVKWIRSDDNEKQGKEKLYWQKYLEGIPTPAPLSVKNPVNAAGKDSGWGFVRNTLNDDLREKLDAFVKNHKITLAAVLYAAWGILLHRYQSALLAIQTDNDAGTGAGSPCVLFGTTVSGRKTGIQGIENMVGLFINTIPLKIQLEKNNRHKSSTALSYLQEIHDNLQERETYETTSLGEIKAQSGIDPHGELFDTLLVIENYPLSTELNTKRFSGGPGGGFLRKEPPADAFTFQSVSSSDRTHYDLTVSFSPGSDFVVVYTYRRETLEEETIARLAGHYDVILRNLLENRDQQPVDIEMLTPEEQDRLVFLFNQTEESGFPFHKTIYELFKDQAEKDPGRIAVKTAANTFTYNHVRQKAECIAEQIRGYGLGSGSIIAIMLDRSIEMMAGVLGILASGAAYLPILPQTPSQRKNYIFEDSGTLLLLSDNNQKTKIEEEMLLVEVLFIDELNSTNDSSSIPPPSSVSQPHDPAYAIYTSGSTGKPKGVLVEHISAVNLLSSLQQLYPLEQHDTFLLKTSFVFDVSLTELFGWFMGGGQLAILEPGSEKEPAEILDAVEYFHVTHINFVPSMFHSFVQYLSARDKTKLSSLKYIFLAGETLSPALVETFQSLDTGVSLHNLYGPTEAAVYASYFPVSQWNRSAVIPIGKPLPNIQLFILDPMTSTRLQPIGVPGELCISGTCVARGYLNQPALTAERFSHLFEKRWGQKLLINLDNFQSIDIGINPDSFVGSDNIDNFLLNNNNPNNSFYGVQGRFLQKEPLGSLYRTGDLARWLPDGSVEYLGRLDRQVKIRGFRIELMEIEVVLSKYKGVKESVVVCREDASGEKVICAYFVPQYPQLTAEVLKEYLKANLPDYMVPAFLTAIPELPATPTGKIDHKALPGPSPSSSSSTGKVFTSPRDKREKRLAEIFAEVLGIDAGRIGIDDSFFELGGHSLKGTGLILRVHKEFSIEISIAELFKNPTIRVLSSFIKTAEEEVYKAIEPVETREFYPASNAQNRFYILQQMDPLSTAYNISEIKFIENTPGIVKLEETFRLLIQRHESLRTSFHVIGKETVQRVNDRVEFRVDLLDNEVEAKTGEELTPVELFHRFIRPFDLSCAPLVRVALAEQPGGRFLLMIDMHHIISDGVSHLVLIKDFISLYKGETQPPLKIQYKDFSNWSLSPRHRQSLKRQELYWLKTFEGVLPILDFPADYPRPVIKDSAGGLVRFVIGAEETQQLKRIVLQEEATLFMGLFAVFNILAWKLTGLEDIIVGTPVACRVHPDLDPIIGVFVNTLVLRQPVHGRLDFLEFLRSVKGNTLEAFENQEYPFEELVEKLRVKRDVSRNPLFDVMFSWDTIPVPEVNVGVLQLKSFSQEERISKFDLSFDGQEQGDELHMLIEYSASIYKKETVMRFAGYFKDILSEVVKNPALKLNEIQVKLDLEEVKAEVLADEGDFGF